MDALILTCGMGGGHNAAAAAIAEELTGQGDRAVMMNPYTLCGERIEKRINGTYISTVQHCPPLFGLVYLLGEMYRRLPFRSPVYFLNKAAAAYLADYLEREHFDVVITTHLFPGEILTWLKNHGVTVPPVLFVATDYTCIPFTEEIDCEAYVVPHEELIEEFVSRGIPKDRIYPLGIPVQASFRRPGTCAEAKAALGLEENTDYLLLAGGSMGAGKISPIVRKLLTLCDDRVRLIVVCGSNRKLYAKLRQKYGDTIILLQSTDRMAEYIRASRIYFTKPGGLSSTEAAVMSALTVHLPPIPGCETRNARFFAGHGMSHRLKCSKKGISRALAMAEDPRVRDEMNRNQREIIHADACAEVCGLARRMDLF
ncbi:MAG: hypothetical protein NC079_05850 [Clostridium sp.]|nr:hypothetical protein [Acetatifactor muris]MCM1526953.1 hypothetical protein [Bacteroides sp.]MCM1563116.1 hypothetical protein [Clostridium sp.]